MPVARRGQAIHATIGGVNRQREELLGCCGESASSPWMARSRVSREAQARICERLGVQFPGATRPSTDARLLVARRLDRHRGAVTHRPLLTPKLEGRMLQRYSSTSITARIHG